jgi:MFS family permease
MAEPESKIVFYSRYAFVVMIMGYHLMELDMIKISFPGFLEQYGVVHKDNKKEVLSRFSELYSWQLVFGIPSTLLWGYISDKYGSFKTSVVHLLVHIGVCSYIAFTTNYDTLFYGHIVLSFFSNYLISVQTFTSWIPQNKKMSFNANSQVITSGMLQIAPFVAGLLIDFSDATNLVRIYHGFLAALLFGLLIGYVISFKDFTEEGTKRSGRVPLKHQQAAVSSLP